MNFLREGIIQIRFGTYIYSKQSIHRNRTVEFDEIKYFVDFSSNS